MGYTFTGSQEAEHDWPPEHTYDNNNYCDTYFVLLWGMYHKYEANALCIFISLNLIKAWGAWYYYYVHFKDPWDPEKDGKWPVQEITELEMARPGMLPV